MLGLAISFDGLQGNPMPQTATMEEGSPLLSLEPYHLSRAAAEAHVESLLRAVGFRMPARGWHSADYRVRTSRAPRVLLWREMVAEARQTGGVEFLDGLLQSKDPYFGSMMSLAVSSSAAKISIEYLGRTVELHGPARIYPVEQELVGDILTYRRMVCERSVPGDFEDVGRFFRSYLFTCISLVDAFINRHVQVAEFTGVNDPAIDAIVHEARLQERVELWLKAFGKNGVARLKQGVKWDAFSKLRQARNAHVHAGEPYFGYRIAALVEPLNACRCGIGELLAFLQVEAGRRPSSIFQRLSTAPRARLNKEQTSS